MIHILAKDTPIISSIRIAQQPGGAAATNEYKIYMKSMISKSIGTMIAFFVVMLKLHFQDHCNIDRTAIINLYV